jgi:hypothetical protein
MRKTKQGIAVLALGFLAACGDNGQQGVCPDDGDPAGPVCMERVESDGEYETLSAVAGTFPTPERHNKYMAPVSDNPELLPTLFQNVNRYGEHLVFLRAVFPEHFPDLDQTKYLELILTREMRQYFSGNFFMFDHPVEGRFYGFTVYTASRSEELLEAGEVKGVYDMLVEVFTAGELRYTFDAFDAMAKEKARTWVEPGFPIYFPD